MKRHSYQYATLRYVHDIASQEFFTVGVAVFSKEQQALEFHFRKTLGLAAEVLGSNAVKNFRALMRSIDARGQQLKSAFESNLLSAAQKASLDTYLLEFFSKDDSALQWSEIKSGLTTDTSVTSERLYERYCGKYDRAKPKDRVTDKEAWQTLHKQLVARRLDSFFSEKKIQGPVDEVKFPFAWKNGLWHCIEPLSFDLSDGDSIRDKAHRHVGEISAIRDATEDFAVYFVATPPSAPELANAFEKAVNLLKSAPHKKIKVVNAGNEGVLLDDFAQKIQQHLQSNSSATLQ